jgi:hypothetical protein
MDSEWWAAGAAGRAGQGRGSGVAGVLDERTGMDGGTVLDERTGGDLTPYPTLICFALESA